MDLLISQLLDPFRIGLIVGLLATALRNRAATGMLIPLVAGVGFIAFLLPSTMGLGLAPNLMQAFVMGVVANAALLALCLGIWEAYTRLRR